MPLYELNGKNPVISEGTWIAPTAAIIGDVTVGPNCWIAFGAIIRADFRRIVIGEGSIIEDNVVIHCARRVEIGDRAIVGHMAMIHDAVIRNDSGPVEDRHRTMLKEGQQLYRKLTAEYRENLRRLA